MPDRMPRGLEPANLALALFASRLFQRAPSGSIQFKVMSGNLKRSAHCRCGVKPPGGCLDALEQRKGLDNAGIEEIPHRLK